MLHFLDIKGGSCHRLLSKVQKASVATSSVIESCGIHSLYTWTIGFAGEKCV